MWREDSDAVIRRGTRDRIFDSVWAQETGLSAGDVYDMAGAGADRIEAGENAYAVISDVVSKAVEKGEAMRRRRRRSNLSGLF